MKTFEKRGPRELLEAEIEGLQAIEATATIRVPRVHGLQQRDGGWVLLLEHLDFARPDASFGQRFGEALAALHAHAPPIPDFGWTCDNFIGATPQVNTRSASWIDFWRECRLEAMCKRLDGHAALRAAVTSILDRMDTLFDGHVAKPSLIHGDLWSGNWGMLPDGTPVIYDPCVSCSDAEAELAIMELFGGVPGGFSEAYRRAGRLHVGYERRKPLYQLYHLLNHVVLFGSTYERQALGCASAFGG
jgi:fructosamine-3-kinase